MNSRELIFKTGAVLSATLTASLGGFGIGESVAFADAPVTFDCSVPADAATYPDCANLPVGTTGTFQTNSDGSTETDYDFHNGDPTATPPTQDGTERVVEDANGRTQYNDVGDGTPETCNYFPKDAQGNLQPEESCDKENGTDNGQTGGTTTGGGTNNGGGDTGGGSTGGNTGGNTGGTVDITAAELAQAQACVNTVGSLAPSENGNNKKFHWSTKILPHQVEKVTMTAPSPAQVFFGTKCAGLVINRTVKLRTEVGNKHREHAHPVSHEQRMITHRNDNGKSRTVAFRRGPINHVKGPKDQFNWDIITVSATTTVDIGTPGAPKDVTLTAQHPAYIQGPLRRN